MTLRSGSRIFGAFGTFKTLGTLLSVALVLQPYAGAQVRKLHTRDLTRLSQVQVASYLKRSDIVFIPVGAVETNGIMPSDRDYVYPLGMAIAMADQLDALYMPGLIWSYPGTTMVASSTVNITPSQGIGYLRAIAESLLKQGFRRQVYISMSQGPAPLTVGTMVREFFDERHVPILYIEMDAQLPRLKLTPEERTKLMYGTHYLAGRIEDIPVQGDYGHAESVAAGAVPENKGLEGLSKLGFSGSLFLGSWVPDVMAHGNGREPALPANAAEREAWGKEGRDQVIAVVKQMHLREAMDNLKLHDEFTNKVLVPKYGKILPGVN